jgi:hypothetical protein
MRVCLTGDAFMVISTRCKLSSYLCVCVCVREREVTVWPGRIDHANCNYGHGGCKNYKND